MGNLLIEKEFLYWTIIHIYIKKGNKNEKILGKIILLTVCMAFMLSGCSSKPDEKKVTEDLKSFDNENLKSGGEKN